MLLLQIITNTNNYEKVQLRKCLNVARQGVTQRACMALLRVYACQVTRDANIAM